MLFLAVGKAAGLVVVWESGPLTKDLVPLPTMSSPPAFTSNAHGSMAVSGVSWARYCLAAQDALGSSWEGGCLLCTTGLDGTVKAWRWHEKQVTTSSSICSAIPLGNVLLTDVVLLSPLMHYSRN